MQVVLRIANGKTNVRKVRLQSDTVIGRSPECQLKVASNQISRRHCQILLRETFVAIKDLGSANGTFVNGRRVPPEVEVPLTPGTRVMLGPLHFTIDYEPAGKAAEPALPEVALDTVTNAADASVADADARNRQARAAAAATAQAGSATKPPVAKVVAVKPDTALSTTASSGLSDTAYITPPAQPTVPEKEPPAAAPVPTPAPPAARAIPSTPPSPPAQPVGPARQPTETSDHDFHFGIFAASGSGVVVESAPEIPMLKAPAPIPAITKPEKPGKKGFFQMLGWGKKEASEAGGGPEPANPASPPAPEARERFEVAEAFDEVELVATPGSDHSFDVIIDDEPAVDPESGGSGSDLNRFFNRAK